MVLAKEDFMEKLKSVVGDRTDDEALTIIEDFTDTYDDLDKRSNEDPEDWKGKYEQLDEEWRKKYKERFFSSEGGEVIEDTVEEKEELEDEKEESVEDILDEIYK